MARFRLNTGFTLVEVLIGMTLGLIVMAGVLSCFVFLSRGLTRLQTEKKFEQQGRLALLYFAQDVRMASAISSPTASSLTLTLLTSSGTTTVTYTYTAGANATGTLTRNPLFTGADATHPALFSNLESLSFNYYDKTGRVYPQGATATTVLTSYVPGIKQVSMNFRLKSSASWNSTQRAFSYQAASDRVILRNKPFLP